MHEILALPNELHSSQLQLQQVSQELLKQHAKEILSVQVGGRIVTARGDDSATDTGLCQFAKRHGDKRRGLRGVPGDVERSMVAHLLRLSGLVQQPGNSSIHQSSGEAEQNLSEKKGSTCLKTLYCFPIWRSCGCPRIFPRLTCHSLLTQISLIQRVRCAVRQGF